MFFSLVSALPFLAFVVHYAVCLRMMNSSLLSGSAWRSMEQEAPKCCRLPMMSPSHASSMCRFDSYIMCSSSLLLGREQMNVGSSASGYSFLTSTWMYVSTCSRKSSGSEVLLTNSGYALARLWNRYVPNVFRSVGMSTFVSLLRLVTSAAISVCG